MAKKKSNRGGARPGSGRPPSGIDTTPIGARIDSKLVAKMEARRKRDGLTKTEAITEAIRLYANSK